MVQLVGRGRLIRTISGHDGGNKDGSPTRGNGLIRGGSKKLLKTLSTANMNVMGALGTGVEGVKAGASLGLELGAAGVAGAKGAAVGVAGVAGAAAGGVAGGVVGVAGGVAGAAGAAGRMAGESLSLSAHKAKGSSAKRRESELNIFGDGAIMTVDNTLKNIQQTKENSTVTKLELEDVVNREDGKEEVVFGAVKDLLTEDGDREWKYIRFVDSIRVGFMGDDASKLKAYETSRQTLWESVKDQAQEKPLQFQVKLEILEDTEVSTICQLFMELLKLNIWRIEYMGGLYGYKGPEIADALVDLCEPEEEGESLAECGTLSDMILLTVHFASETGTMPASAPKEDKNWRKVLRKCIGRLKGKASSNSGEESDLKAMRAAATSRPSSRSRSKSPKRELPSNGPRKPALARATSEHDPMPRPPTLSRAVSEQQPRSRGLDLSGSSHHRRRKGSPTMDPKKKSAAPRPSARAMANVRQRASRSPSPKRNTADPNLMKMAAMAAAKSSTDSLGGGSSHHRRRMNIHIVPLADDDDLSEGSFGDEAAVPKPRRVIRSASSPMQKRSSPTSSPTKGVKRAVSMQKKDRPSTKPKPDAKDGSNKKCPAHKEEERLPDYDWSSHDHTADCDSCRAAAKSA